MESNSLKSKINLFAGAKLLFAGLALYRLIPAALGLPLAAAIGRMTRHFCKREVNIAVAQYRYVLGGNEVASDAPTTDEEKRFVAKVFGHVGESFGEVLTLDRIVAARLPDDPSLPPWRRSLKHIRSIGQEHVDALLRENKGAITLSGHLGCFELLAAYHVQQGVAISVAARDANYRWFDLFLDDLRRAYGVETVWRNAPDGARRLMRALKDGRVAAVLIDQDTGLDNLYSPFFDLDAAHPSAPIRLAIRFRTPVLTSFIYRERRGYHCVVTEPVEYDPDDPLAAEKILEVYNARLQQLILAHPEQWLWWHRRWRRRPGVDYVKDPDALPSTKRYLAWLRQQRRPLPHTSSPHNFGTGSS